MIRVILFLAAILALATGLSWLADRPGNLTINWEGYVIETSVFRAVVISAFSIGLALVTWSILRHLWNSPAAVGGLMNKRRQKKGLEALSAGMIAVGAGDRAGATRYAIAARKTLPNEPMTHLLRAQAAQLAGDKTTSRRIFEAMLASPDTEPLGLRGLFVEAQRENETEAARHFAERALKINPRLIWASDALFEIQCKSRDWPGALETLTSARKNGLTEKPLADRRRAVLLTALAMKAEDNEPDKALNLAIEAHNLAPDLVPAATMAGRMLASRGNTPKAAKVMERAWAKSPHPDLATVYAYARVGDSPRDRLVRVKRLADQNPHSIESAIALANAAIDARAFDEARNALKPMLDERLTQRIATLMARIESEQHGDKGRVREWLARAVNAPRDPVWTADGVVIDDWAPISPVTGMLDAVQWKVPVENASPRDQDVLARKVEELVALGAPPAIDADADEAITLEPETVTAKPSTSRTAARPEPTRVEPARLQPVETQATRTEPQRGEQARPQPAANATPHGATEPKSPASVAAPSATARSTPASSTPAPAAPAKTPQSVPAKTPSSQPVASAKPQPGAAAPATSAAVPDPVKAAEVKPAEAPAASAAVTKTASPTAAAAPSRPVAAEPSIASNADSMKGPARQPDATAAVSKSATPKSTTGKDTVVRDVAGKEPAGKEATAKEARIFVVPHAPDDPGPDGADTEAAPPKGARPPYRALP